jgi:hypothetical protein
MFHIPRKSLWIPEMIQKHQQNAKSRTFLCGHRKENMRGANLPSEYLYQSIWEYSL